MPDSLESLRAGRLAGATRLDLSCGLTEFPPEIFDLADTLEVLNLSGNQLTHLPDDLPRLHRLRILFCSENHFTELPTVVGQCPSLQMIGFKSNAITTIHANAFPPALRWLILTDNLIATLPDSIGQCSQLQKLMLAGNRLTELPASLAACTQLELLRISANRFADLPQWLFELPRLSWLALGGNPCCPQLEPAPLPAMDWSDLTLHELLGEGASGTIHRADWRDGITTRPTAVKLFKGSVTSDGLPSSELDAALAAGRHPHLIPLAGRLSGHPDGTQGLVMDLIEPVFQTLAGPPDFDTCTRDVYPAHLRLSPTAAHQIARSIAAAAAHLHSRGIHHGDLYAHNILWRPDGHSLLGDFGAATACPPPHATALQRLEVRAFGCLLEELIQHTQWTTADTDTQATFLDLQDRCLRAATHMRPLFAEIATALTQIKTSP